jgi:hypothetical protein
MDTEKIRARVAELRRIADELEAMLPAPVLEEDIVIIEDPETLPFIEAKPAKTEICGDAFQQEINDAIARILR